MTLHFFCGEVRTLRLRPTAILVGGFFLFASSWDPFSGSSGFLGSCCFFDLGFLLVLFVLPLLFLRLPLAAGLVLRALFFVLLNLS